MTEKQETDTSYFHDDKSVSIRVRFSYRKLNVEQSTDLDVVSKESLVEWLAKKYKSFGAKMEFITNRSQEGSQFCRGFGGIGGACRRCLLLRAVVYDGTAGLLRYQVDFMQYHQEAAAEADDDEEEEEEDEEELFNEPDADADFM